MKDICLAVNSEGVKVRGFVSGPHEVFTLWSRKESVRQPRNHDSDICTRLFAGGIGVGDRESG